MLVTQITIFLQRAVDDVFQLGWQLWIQPHRRRGYPIQDLVEDDA